MILIVSNDKDTSSNNVIKYLHLHRIPFLRLTESNFIESLNIKLSNNQFEFEFIENQKNKGNMIDLVLKRKMDTINVRLLESQIR